MTKQLNERFKSFVYWNNYETKPAKVIEKGKDLYELLNASLQGVKRLFVFAYVIAAPPDNNAADDTAGIKKIKSIFSQEENYNVLIDGRKFYDQPINDITNQFDEVRKVLTWYGDDYTNGCLLDYAYFKDNCGLIAVDLSKQKALDAYPRAIQQIIFQGVVEGDAGTKIRLYSILEPSKETMLEFSKGTAKVLQLHTNG